MRVGEAAEAPRFHDVVVFHLQYDQAAVDLDSGLGFERDDHSFLEDLVSPHPVSPVDCRQLACPQADAVAHRIWGVRQALLAQPRIDRLMDARGPDAGPGEGLAHTVRGEQLPVNVQDFRWRLPNESGPGHVRGVSARPVTADVEEERVTLPELIPDGEPGTAPAPEIAQRVAQELHACRL